MNSLNPGRLAQSVERLTVRTGGRASSIFGTVPVLRVSKTEVEDIVKARFMRDSDEHV